MRNNLFASKRKCFLSLLLMILCANIGLFGQNRFIHFTDKGMKKSTKDLTKEEVSPKREISSSKSSCVITYKLPGGFVANTLVGDDEMYEYIHVDGFGKMGQIGKPALPAHNDLVATLGSRNPKVEILSVKYVEYDEFNIHPALAPARDTEGEDEVVFEKDLILYSTNAFFPEKVVDIEEVLEYRGQYFSSIQVRPVQYNPVTKKIRVYSEIKYKVNYSESSKAIDEKLESFKSVILNPEVIEEQKGKASRSAFDSKDPNYLIIARKDFFQAAKELAQWKSQLGYRTELIFKDQWTSEEVKEAIHSRFAAYNPAPTYFVIIGDHEQVPGEILIKSDDNGSHQFASDLYYACTGGGSDYYPDMAKGRIPANSPEQALMMVRKGVNYEKTPVNEASFYENGLNCAQFQDVQSNEAADGYAARRFCHTSEEVRDYVTSLGYDVERVYYTDPSHSPTNFNNGYYSDGQKIPDELLRKNGFAWDGGSDDISREINEGKFYVLHRDHGYAGGVGWAHPQFLTSEISSLNNAEKLPVVFSMNCHTGEFLLENCFAEQFVRHENGGAVGVIAASYYSYSGYNDGLTVGMFDAIWSNPGIRPNFGAGGEIPNPANLPGHQNNIRSMGDVLNQGLIRMRETWSGSASAYLYTHRLFHYFGDPALKIWTKQPEVITATYNKTIAAKTKTFSLSEISVDKGIITLTQRDSIIAKMEINGSDAVLNFSEISNEYPLVLTISSEDCKPVVDEIIVTGGDKAPVPAFVSSLYNIIQDGTDRKVVTLTNKSTFNPKTFEWTISPNTFEFTDGTNANSENPKLKFLANGSYSVSLKVTNDNGSANLDKSDLIFVGSIKNATCSPVTRNLANNYKMGLYYFQLTEISNSSSNSVNDHNANGNKGYMNFTSKVATLKKGHPADYVVKAGAKNPQALTVFIDYNDDGDFDDENEKVDQIGKFNNNITSRFTVTSNTTAELVRLRVITDYYKMVPDNGCYSPKYGQVEDYTVRFINAEPVIAVTSVENISFSSCQVSAKILSNGGENIQERGIIYSTSEDANLSSWTKVVSNSNSDLFSANITGLKKNTTYYVKTYAVNSIGTAYSEKTISFTTFSDDNPSEYPTNFVTTKRSSSSLEFSWKDAGGVVLPYGYVIKLSSVGLGDITNPINGTSETESESVKLIQFGENKVEFTGLNSDTKYFAKIYPFVNEGDEIKYKTDGDAPSLEVSTKKFGVYTNFTAKGVYNISKLTFNTISNADSRANQMYIDFRDSYETNVKPGETYTLSVQVDPGGKYNFYTVAWIDWNRNGVFENEERTVFDPLVGAGTVTKDIVVPNDAVEDWTTMRVVYVYGGASSSPAPIPTNDLQNPTGYGSAEDYKIVVNKDVKTPGLWKGTVSSVWNEAGNWDNNLVPDDAVAVQIKSDVVNFPVLSSNQSVKNIVLYDGANLIVKEGAYINIAEGLSIKDGGQFKFEGGSISLQGNLEIGNGTSGEFIIENGIIVIVGDIYTEIGSTVSVLGGKITANNWNKSGTSIWSKGNIHFKAGEINISDTFSFSSSDCSVIMDGPILIKVGGYLYNNSKNWTVSNGTFVLNGNAETSVLASSTGATLAAYNIIVENPAGVWFNRKTEGKESGVEVKGDFTVKASAKAYFVRADFPNLFVNIAGDLKVESGATLVTGSTMHTLKGNVLIEGELIAVNSVFNFNGEAVQELVSNSEIPVLEVNNAKGVKLVGDTKIEQKLKLVNSPLSLNGKNLSLQSEAIIEDVENLTYPNVIISDNAASIRKVINTDKLDNYLLPVGNSTNYLPASFSISGVSPAKKYIAFKFVNEADASLKSNKAIGRTWDISTEDGFGNFSLNANLNYLDSDLGSLSEADLVVAIKDGDWKKCGTINAENNQLEISISKAGVVTALDKTLLTTSVNELSNDIVKVYPNPSSGVFTIDCITNSEELYSLNVYNQVGQLVLNQKMESGLNKTVDITSFESGVYIFRFISSEFNGIKRVVKK